jgi:hypothetical protein
LLAHLPVVVAKSLNLHAIPFAAQNNTRLCCSPKRRNRKTRYIERDGVRC